MRRNELFYIVVFGSGSAAGKESVRERESVDRENGERSDGSVVGYES